jgi:hypothetical protein
MDKWGYFAFMPPARPEQARGVHVTDYEAGQIPRVPTPRPPTLRQRTLPDAPVQLADDEVYVRKYEAVRAGGRSGGSGTLYVTNARLIFYAKARGRGTSSTRRREEGERSAQAHSCSRPG